MIKVERVQAKLRKYTLYYMFSSGIDVNTAETYDNLKLINLEDFRRLRRFF